MAWPMWKKTKKNQKKPVIKCKIPGCRKPVKARGFCNNHYYKFMKNRPIEELEKSQNQTYPELACQNCGYRIKLDFNAYKLWQRLAEVKCPKCGQIRGEANIND